jgi:26S proteasome regulatory subunit N2
LKDVTIGGIILMQYNSQTEQVLVEPVAACGPKNEDVKEPEAPEPFEWVE